MADASPYILAGIMGDPVLHSRSPMIYEHWLAEHGLKGRYVLLPTPASRLGAALRALPALGFRGVNLTIPHKEAALVLVDEVAPTARAMGAINLVTVQEDGSLSGHNTDWLGWLTSVESEHTAWRAPAAPSVVIGAGGGARAVIVSLLQRKATEIRVCNRSPDRAEALAAEFGAAVRVVPWRDRAAALAGVGLMVNTTSQGMTGMAALDVPLDDLPTTAIVSDIVYNPLVTPLLAAARRRGNPIVDGLGMLLHQARPCFEAYAGIEPVVSAALRTKIVATL